MAKRSSHSNTGNISDMISLSNTTLGASRPRNNIIGGHRSRSASQLKYFTARLNFKTSHFYFEQIPKVRKLTVEEFFDYFKQLTVTSYFGSCLL